MDSLYQVPEGQLTSTVYRHIENREYDQAIGILREQLKFFPESTAAASLLAYCYYHSGDFQSALQLYERLVRRLPDNERYTMCLANVRYKLEMYTECQQTLRAEGHDADVLRAYCKHDTDDTVSLQNLVDKLTKEPTDDYRVFTLQGNLLLKQEKVQEAIDLYNAANEIRADPRIHYNKAYAYYKQSDYTNCLKTLGQLVDVASKQFPDLVDAAREFNDAGEAERVSLVQNQNHLLQSALIDAFNLKAAIEWNLGDENACERALKAMPQRREEDLDAVTVHNLALSEMLNSPSQAVKKLRFLIQNPPFPVEAFQNLVTIYVQNGLFDLAADLMAENQELAKVSVFPEKFAYFQAVTLCETSPEEAYSILDQLKSRYASQLKRLRQEITVLRQKMGQKSVKVQNQGRFNVNAVSTMSAEEIQVQTMLRQYEDKLSMFVPVVTWQCSILYQLRKYRGAFYVLNQYQDLIEEHASFTQNQANIMFANEDYEGALEKYQQVKDQLGAENILDVPAIALANLCVCYVLNGQNQIAEQIMQKVDTAQKAIRDINPDASSQLVHLSIINIVLGTLYAINDNMPFGIQRVINAMEDVHNLLTADSWLYIKRPLLAFAESCAMNTNGPIQEDLVDMVIVFLDQVIKYGDDIDINTAQVGFGVEKVTIAHEARSLKAVFLQLM